MEGNIEAIKDKIEFFCNSNLNKEYSNISLNILNEINKCDSKILESSRNEIWAASIINLVLEQNLLYNKKHPLYITKKDFSNKLGVCTKTIKNKTSIVKDLCEINSMDKNIIAQSNIDFWIEENSKDLESIVERDRLLYSKYMTLAYEHKNDDKYINYFNEAIKIGKSMIAENVGTEDYWSDISTRAYMIAMQDFGNVLLTNNKLYESRQVFEELLNLNPKDDQGVRFNLLNILIKLNDRKSINYLFGKYKDERCATWIYSKSLYYFKNKNNFMARDNLRQGIKRNKYIGLYLIKWDSFILNNYVDEELKVEGKYYYKENFDIWNQCKGSLDWLLKEMIGQNK